MPELSHWAAVAPDRLAIVSTAGNRTFAELDANSNRLARALRKRGLESGDAVALVASNQPTFVETLYACLRSGFRLTPVNWHLTGEEAAYIVNDCEAKALVATADRFEAAGRCLMGAPACKVALLAGKEEQPFENYERAIAAEPGGPLQDSEPGSTMLYTSGTTGRPKGVHRPPAPVGDAMNLGGYDETGGNAHLCAGPLYHSAPLAFSLREPLTFGASVIMMDGWDAEEALRLIQEHGVTHTHMVPTMFHRLLSLPEEVRSGYDLSSLRCVLHGAAPCPIPVKQRMIEWLGPVLLEYYAATEGIGSLVDSASWLEHPGTVGRPIFKDKLYVGDEMGNRLDVGEAGLVFIRASEAMGFEYFKDPAKTDSAFRGAYFTLGDVGYLDSEGFLYLTDRSANLIISGGVNIYPAEVDAILLEHASVSDAAVIGVPDEEWGEVVLAVIELKAGIEPSDALATELVEHCRNALAHYKCPRRIEFVSALPREDNGKIYKRRLREQYRNNSDAMGSTQ